MATTIELAKVIVITETHFEQEMLTSFRKLGIKGFESVRVRDPDKFIT